MLKKDNNAATVDELIETGKANGKEVLIAQLVYQVVQLLYCTIYSVSAKKIEYLHLNADLYK